MACYQLVFAFLITISALLNQAISGSSLNLEGMVGGKPAPPRSFKYMASIQSSSLEKPHEHIPLCGGAIVNEWHVAAASACFVDEQGRLWEESFSVVVETVNLTLGDGRRVKILKIYLPGFDTDFTQYNFAMTLLMEALDLGFNSLLRAVKLPPKFAEFENAPAVVSGYGYEFVVTVVREPLERGGKPVHERFTGYTRNILKFGFVLISEDKYCLKHDYRLVDRYQMCGVQHTETEGARWGICTGDIGAPLVVLDNVLVGIANRNSPNCDDTGRGAKYAKVSYHIPFIKGVLMKKYVSGTIEFSNNFFHPL